MWKGSSRKTIKDKLKIAKRPLETRFEENMKKQNLINSHQTSSFHLDHHLLVLLESCLREH